MENIILQIMAKYIKINDCMDIIEVNDEIIGEKHYCWNCEIKWWLL